MDINVQEVRGWWDNMKRGQLVEIRILSHKWPNGQDGPTYSGFFENIDDIIRALQEFEPSAGCPAVKGTYYLMNRPQDYCRTWPQYGRILRGVTTANGNDILQRDYFFIDFDPKREPDTCSTDEELERAGNVCKQFREAAGLPQPYCEAVSGNGIHLIYRLAPSGSEDEQHGAIHGLLRAAKERFASSRIIIDTTVANRARICRLPGTLNCKGNNTPERPHRLCFAQYNTDAPAVSLDDLKAATRALLPVAENMPTSTKEPEKMQNNGDLAALLRDVEDCIEQLEGKGVRIPADRDEWFRILAGWYHSLRADGKLLFLRFNELWENAETPADALKYDEIGRYPRPDGATIQSFFTLCKKYGIEPQLDYRQYALDYSQPCPEPPVLLSVAGVGVAFREGLTTIVGAKKAGKSTLVSAVCACFLSGFEVLRFGASDDTRKLLLCDTEQPGYRLHRQIQRSFDLARLPARQREDFVVLPLRPYDATNRLRIVLATVRRFRPDICIIDGITDLLRNVNDIEESEAVVSQLLALSSECSCAILAVVHTNSTDPTGKQRGHVGSVLERKQECSVLLEKNEDTGVFRVSARDCRDKPFMPFGFERDGNGDPREVMVADTAPDKLLALMQPDEEYKHAELVKLLAEAGVRADNAKKAIKRLCERRLIIKGQQGTYRLPQIGHPDEAQGTGDSPINRECPQSL